MKRNFSYGLLFLFWTTVIQAQLMDQSGNYPAGSVSSFAERLEPVGRILEEDDYYVWCCAPMMDDNDKVHVFYSRWKKQYGMGGWIGRCEIAHAVADQPEGPYKYVSTVLASRPGYFDSATCHNPSIYNVDGRYWLFYMGTADGKFGTKRIGYAVADSPWGPWERCDEPLLMPGNSGEWDDYITTNPAFLKHPNGEYWLYYKSCNEYEYLNQRINGISGNRKYGVAFADNITGPYRRYEKNPVVDFSVYGENRQVEDAYIWYEDGIFKMLMRDMGFYDHTVGLYFESKDGLNWGTPQIGWFGAEHYFEQPPAPKHLTRYGRFERPQLLMKDGKPAYLFCTTQGGKAETASGFVFRIKTE
ncbi:MAG: glycoside hydrolase family protein [Tannerella sp.]|jgi:hypothetical protein|nr:glycoside hydrolase family protein [Tannerella sp.]